METKPLTIEDLAKFTEEVLLPAIDGRFEVVDKRFDAMDKRFDAIESELSEIKQELSIIRRDLSSLEVRLERLEKTNRKDIDAFGGDILGLKEKVKEPENRLRLVEASH